MAVYTVHRFMPIEASGEERKAFSGEHVFVKEAFAWPAFFFAGFWAFWQRMWLIGLALLAVPLVLDVGLACWVRTPSHVRWFFWDIFLLSAVLRMTGGAPG